MKIKGITVVLHEKTKVGTDGFGADEYEVNKIPISNILVYPSTTDEMTTTTNLTGKTARYTLCIPKGDTHTWTDTVVEFFGSKWRTVGIPMEYIDELVPLKWNKKIMVECYE